MRLILPVFLLVALVGCQAPPTTVPENPRMSEARILPAGLEGMREIRQASWYQFEALKALERAYNGRTTEDQIIGFDLAIAHLAGCLDRYEAALKVLPPHLGAPVEDQIEHVQEMMVNCYRYRPIEAVYRAKSFYANNPALWSEIKPDFEN